MPLEQALQINYFGPLRLLELARDSKNLECLTHVSTSYVNADKKGYISEKVYDYSYDPEHMVQDILSIPLPLLA